MTEHRPPACHYDRHLGERVTTEHRDDCQDPAGHRGCKPCTAPHCTVCGRTHATNEPAHHLPVLPGQGRPGPRRDRHRIRRPRRTRPPTAAGTAASSQLHPSPAAPRRSSAAQPRLGVRTLPRLDASDYLRDHPVSRPHRPTQRPRPTARHPRRCGRTLYRAWLGHGPAAPRHRRRRSRLPPAQLPYLAQRTDGPDWHAFTREVRDLRSQLEHALHDGRDPERGVECFECGDTLVRRWRRAAPLHPPTPPRLELAALGRARLPRGPHRRRRPRRLPAVRRLRPGRHREPVSRRSRGSARAAARSTTRASTPPPYAVTSSPVAPTVTGGRTSRWPLRRSR